MTFHSRRFMSHGMLERIILIAVPGRSAYNRTHAPGTRGTWRTPRQIGALRHAEAACFKREHIRRRRPNKGYSMRINMAASEMAVALRPPPCAYSALGDIGASARTVAGWANGGTRLAIDRVLVGGLGLALLAASLMPWGEAAATIPDANGAYWGCYTKSTGAIKLIDNAVTACKSGETMVSWNAKGQQGAAGPTGLTGPAGPTGLAGQDATKADGPCFNNDTDRYQDCGNGTVTDTVTGLIWLKYAGCISTDSWRAANTAAGQVKNGDCNLLDNSAAGDWRLPTAAEWTATMARPLALTCSPALTNTTGTACYSAGPRPFTDVHSDYHWSSSGYEIDGDSAWVARLSSGTTGPYGKINIMSVWPVRAGR